MTPQVVALLGGLLFLLIAIGGGGFTIREIIMPGVRPWARAASLIVGVALVVPYFATGSGPRPSGAAAADSQPASATVAAGEFFPCYALRSGSHCPDEWRAFDVSVG